jgi:hypothetical protein
LVSGLQCLGKVTGSYNQQEEARIIIQDFTSAMMKAFKAQDLTIVLKKGAFTQDCNMDVDDSIYSVVIEDAFDVLD